MNRAPLLCALLLLHAVQRAPGAPRYVFDRPICSGLGDRMGTMMTLATLARLRGARVVFEWCNDTSVVYHRYRDFIPGFHGWHYNLTELRGRLSLPGELEVVERLSADHQRLPRVAWEGVGVPAEQGSDAVYTVAWRTTSLGPGGGAVDGRLFQGAYREVTRRVAASAAAREAAPYIVLHMRGPDENTYSFPGSHDDLDFYCTGRALKALLRLKLERPPKIYAISNNVAWASELLDGRVTVLSGTSAYDDFELLLGATAIVQHAYGGWSSYSTVPAMMAGVPLLTTYDGAPQRLLLFRAQGGVPEELHTCRQVRAFARKVSRLFTALESPEN